MLPFLRIARFALFPSLLWVAACQEAALPLVEDGRPVATIVLAAEASEETQRAAAELQAYVQQIAQATLPIRPEAVAGPQVVVGVDPDAYASPHTVGYRVEGQTLYVGGGSPQACLDAVYVLLEREFGCRFFSPEAERVPTQASLRLPRQLSYAYTPAITTRTVHSRLFYDHPAFADKLRVTKEGFPRYVPEARVHTFHRFVPAANFYAAHPEYYALRNGRRLTTQLCLTNEAVFEVVRDSVAAHLARHPEADVISVSQDDNTQYCQCEACEAIHEAEGTPAGSMIHFVNRVAEEFPDKQISTLAYQYTRKAPNTLRPRENVLITLCSIECDRSAPIGEACEDFAQDLREWAQLTDNLRIWDYTTQFTNFLAPFPNLHTLQPNLELFVDHNASWVFEQHSYHPSALFELRSYLMAQLLWQPRADAEAIIEEFTNGYYGAGGPYVKAYLERLHHALAQDSSFFLFLYGDPSQGFDSFLQGDSLRSYDRLFEAAAAAVAEDEALHARVQGARLGVDYASLEYARQTMGEAAHSPDLARRLERFAQTTQAADIQRMNEMGYTVAEYLDTYAKTMERAKGRNLAKGKAVRLLTRPKKYAEEDPQALTDGAFGGSNFYANWLGFEGNDLEAVIDLGEAMEIRRVSTAFLQVTNHIVFFPRSVEFAYSLDGESFQPLAQLPNPRPLTPESKVNDIQYVEVETRPVRARYIKVVGRSLQLAPDWHHAAGLPSWIFVDEVMVE